MFENLSKIKLEIFLLIIKNSDLANLLDDICLYLKLFDSQAINLIEKAEEKKFIEYNKDANNYILSYLGNNYLKENKLDRINLREIGKNFNFIDQYYYDNLD